MNWCFILKQNTGLYFLFHLTLELVEEVRAIYEPGISQTFHNATTMFTLVPKNPRKSTSA